MENSMKTFGVVRLADKWTITVQGKRWGQFLYRVDAEEAALRLAAQVSAEGGAAEVLVQEGAGEITRLNVG